MIKVCLVVLSLLSLEICPATTTPSPVVRSRVEHTCVQRWLDRASRRDRQRLQCAETVVLAKSDTAPSMPRSVPVVLGHRVRRGV